MVMGIPFYCSHVPPDKLAPATTVPTICKSQIHAESCRVSAATVKQVRLSDRDARERDATFAA
jgi:hypothetical protein